ncbi:MAG: HAD-IA family hydrolase [Cyanobacteria bacterium J06621_11]
MSSQQSSSNPPSPKPNSGKTSAAQIFSFDVFDTCVTRCYIKPTDIFEPLFTQLLAKTDCPSHHLSAAAKTLAQQRIVAERTAHQNISHQDSAKEKGREKRKEKSKREEIEMIDIYQLLAPQLAHYGLSAQQAMNAEIEQELSVLSPILSTHRKIKQLRSQGHKIGFISDMYLPGTVVRQILATHGFFEPEDFLYVSSDVGYTKGSGKLFHHACQQLKITPAKLHHTGDNFYADVRAANKAGLRWTHFKQGNPNRYESAHRVALCSNASEATWHQSYLIGLSRAIRLQHDQKTASSQQQAMLSANILAPLLAGYILWILHTARQADIQQLYYTDPLGEKLSDLATRIIETGSGHAAEKIRFSPQPNQTAHFFNQTDSDRSQYGIGAILEGPQTTTSHSGSPHQKTKQKLCFNLLPAAQPRALQTAAPNHLHQSYLASSPSLQSTSHKFPEGLAYLVTHRTVLETLLKSIASSHTEPYWHIITQYTHQIATSQIATSQIATSNQAQSPQLAQSHHTQLLDTLKRYATSNLIHFLTQPTSDDAAALLRLKAIAAPACHQTPALASPIPLHKSLNLIKHTVKQSSPSSDRAGSWLNASVSLSSWPTKQLSNQLLRPVQQLYQHILTQRPLWFYKPILRLQALRNRQRKS